VGAVAVTVVCLNRPGPGAGGQQATPGTPGTGSRDCHRMKTRYRAATTSSRWG